MDVSDIEITDAQVHLWRPDTPDHPWPEGTHQFAHGRSMSAGRMLRLMDDAGVRRAVLVPPSWAGDSNEYCAEAARHHPDRFAVAGRVPLQTPLPADELRAVRDRWALKALRFTFARGAAARWMVDGTADWLWGAAQALDLPVFIYAPGLSEQIDAVASSYPGLRLTLDHLTLNTAWRDDELTEPLERVVELARHPQLSVKASALHTSVSDPYPFRSLHDRLRAVVEAYGPERVFWGSDVTRQPGTYRQAVTMFTEGLDFLDDRSLALVMGDALSAHLDWWP